MAAAAGLLLASCREPAGSSEMAEPPEASFRDQAEAVRRGESDGIRLSRATVADADLDELAGLEDQLRRLNLANSDITDAGLARIAGMNGLVQLRLAAPRVTDQGLVSLAQLKELRHLHLIDVPITDAGIAHLERLTALESLYLDHSRLSEAGMRSLVEALAQTHLHFDGGHHAETKDESGRMKDE